MLRDAVEQAKQRLLRAERSLRDLTEATTAQDAEDAWIDFLLAAANIYSKLEQGAKGNSKSEPWFGQKKARATHRSTSIVLASRKKLQRTWHRAYCWCDPCQP